MIYLALGGLLVGSALGPRLGVRVDLKGMTWFQSEVWEGEEKVGSQGCLGAPVIEGGVGISLHVAPK